MERKTIIQHLKNIDTYFGNLSDDQLINVNRLIEDLKRFLKLHGDNLYIRVTGETDSWWTSDIELEVHRPETDEEVADRLKREKAAKQHEKLARQKRYEELKKEFEGEEEGNDGEA